MSLDLQLGLITVGMAVLGGVVSAHGPRHLAWKIVYGFAFCLFGGYAIMLVVKQSAQSASASAKLSESISELSQSSHENTRLADLNSRLQERLLGLSKKTIEGVFGGGYPVLFVMANFDGNRKPGAMLLNSGKSNIYDINIVVGEAGKPGETEESMLRKIHEQKGASIPLLTPGDFMPVPITFPTKQEITGQRFPLETGM